MSMAVSALQIEIRGQVQGVGFRPFVYNLAQRFGVIGSVANGPKGVTIFAQADKAQLDQFVAQLTSEQPSMSEIESLDVTSIAVEPGLAQFKIIQSEQGDLDLSVTPDAAVCQDCLSELFDPNNRRYLYPFINCTHCGPRYSLITALPYDRPNTTMAKFQLCHRCDSEYTDPVDRRFHAQPTACSECGPQLSFYCEDGQQLQCNDPVAQTIELIQQGNIVAIKGVGGFHLACDARNPEAVRRLRERKHRDEKPLAVMAANPESLQSYVELTDQRVQRLKAMDAPICLVPKRENSTLVSKEPLPEELAPDQAWLGVMLPHSPLHYLLFHKDAGSPDGIQWLAEKQDLLLVMTSANRSGNPQVINNAEALIQLQGIADGYLMHDRDIHTRCDDSVVSMVSEQGSELVRRGRGLSPQYIKLPFETDAQLPSVLAVGAYFKNTVCLTKGNRAYVSQYIGDLDNPECCRQLNHTVEQLSAMLDIKPELVVADLHPEFYSTGFAQRFSQANKVPMLQVQHHHAHIAAVIAERGVQEPVLGLALDGLGLGDDGALWGGELFKVHQGDYQRLSSLSPIPLPGGDSAAKEPWRVASGVLFQLDRTEQIEARFGDQKAAPMISQLLQKNINTPMMSSAGRVFDAVAALLGLKEINAYEAQAAMALESAAYRYLKSHPWPNESLLIDTKQSPLNLEPLFARLLDCDDQGYGAALFHQQLITALSRWVADSAVKEGINKVVLAGGCFLNQLLLQGITEQLEAQNLQVFTARKLPCNDGSISLGQAQIALERANLARQNKNKNDNDKNNERESLCV
ncbi:carbamoyltransferase HypF [Neptuniibacter sp. QD48_55]|uniref:carbamoyltransferase HypF n=1 Tax=Neptuniibacter sp. QD48_55 TaxID=3398212 RepID=UPI0039F5392F